VLLFWGVVGIAFFGWVVGAVFSWMDVVFLVAFEEKKIDSIVFFSLMIKLHNLI